MWTLCLNVCVSASSQLLGVLFSSSAAQVCSLFRPMRRGRNWVHDGIWGRRTTQYDSCHTTVVVCQPHTEPTLWAPTLWPMRALSATSQVLAFGLWAPTGWLTLCARECVQGLRSNALSVLTNLVALLSTHDRAKPLGADAPADARAFSNVTSACFWTLGADGLAHPMRTAMRSGAQIRCPECAYQPSRTFEHA